MQEFFCIWNKASQLGSIDHNFPNNIMGYNVKHCQKLKDHIENTKMAKFEAPGIKEQVYVSTNSRKT